MLKRVEWRHRQTYSKAEQGYEKTVGHSVLGEAPFVVVVGEQRAKEMD